jgi:hypothetical protein
LTFEEVFLKFYELESREFLLVYLMKKMEGFEKGPKSIVCGGLILETMLHEFDVLTIGQESVADLKDVKLAKKESMGFDSVHNSPMVNRNAARIMPPVIQKYSSGTDIISSVDNWLQQVDNANTSRENINDLGGMASATSVSSAKQLTCVDGLQSVDTNILQMSHRIKNFLKINKQKLYPSTIYSLLKEHSKPDFVLYYAELIEDWDYCCEIHASNHDFSNILTILGTQVRKI